MAKEYYRMQRHVGHLTYNGDPWQYTSTLSTLENARGMLAFFRQLYPGRQYRVVEQLTEEIYDIVPETPTNG